MRELKQKAHTIDKETKISIGILITILGVVAFYFSYTPTIEYIDKQIQSAQIRSDERVKDIREELKYLRTRIDSIYKMINHGNK